MKQSKINTMSSIEIRKELHQYIDNSTDEVIAAVYALLKTYNTTHSEETDIDEYNKDIDAAMKEMDKGEYTPHEEVRKSLLK